VTEVLVDLDSLAPGGDAAGRQCAEVASGGGPGASSGAGRVVFVPLAAPGDRARVQLVREKERVAWGELVAVERPGPDRVVAPCRLFGRCGGCQWQHVTIAAQHQAKKTIVERALGLRATAPIAPIDDASGVISDAAPCTVRILGASPAFGYRDRARLAVGQGPAPRPVGFRARRSHEIVDVPTCPLFSRALEAALPAVRALAARLPAGAEIDLQAGAEGVHVNVAQVDAAGAALARREAEGLTAAGVDGLAIGGKPTSGLTEVDVAERGGPRLSVPAGGFAQVGRAGNAVLVDRVLGAVGPAPGSVLELYAGSGNFTRHLVVVAAQVHACEGDPAAVARGRLAAPAASWSARVPDIAADVVLLDPPREGADAANLTAALRARRRIVYVSCDPQTLSRDARRIVAAGFRLTQALALDLMPQTFHVEIVATFDRECDRESDGAI
jgi:23S rRNA (uracil1939-C5)-methyltransferase